VFLYASALAWTSSPAPSDEQYDVIIKNGHIIDGTGNPWYAADVGIRGDRVIALLRSETSKRRPQSRRSMRLVWLYHPAL
jgi:adenine deaminase